MQSEMRYYRDGERVRAEEALGFGVDAFVPAVGGGEEDGGAEAPITLKVRDSTGDEMVFRVKRGTQMRKIFEAYAQRLGVSAATLKFSIDGERIKDEDTPKMLELQNDDQIDVFINQTGGSEDVKPDDIAITVKVKEGSGDEIAFKVKRSTKMSKIMEAYANRRGIELSSLRFMFDGNRVNAEDTPKTLEMEDGDLIDARVEQLGGL